MSEFLVNVAEYGQTAAPAAGHQPERLRGERTGTGTEDDITEQRPAESSFLQGWTGS